MKKPRPTIEKMREDVTRFEIEEVYYSADYQAIIEEDHFGEQEWQSEEDIVEHYKNEDDGEIEFLWDEWFNQFGDYEEGVSYLENGKSHRTESLEETKD